MNRLLAWLPPLLLAGALNAQVSAAEPLLVLVDDAHPPFSYLDEAGQARGLVVDMLGLLLAPDQPKPAIQAVPWRRGLAVFQHRPNVLLASVVRLPEREHAFLWVGPLFEEPIWLYSLRERELAVNSVADLAGLRIGTPADSASYRQLLALGIPAESIETVANPSQNLHKLLAGRLDLITAQPATLQWNAAQQGLTGVPFKQVFRLSAPLTFYLTASPGTSPALLEQWQQRLRESEASDELNRLRQQYGTGALAQPASPAR